MRTDLAIDKLINIAPIIADVRPKLQENESFKTLISESKDQKDNINYVLKVLPMLLKNYRKEIYSILAIWCDKTVDEIANQSFGETIKIIKDLFSDDDFKSFFTNA